MRTVDEVVTRMPNAKIFSVLDANSGFWQIHLDNDSAKLCTFNTPYDQKVTIWIIIIPRHLPTNYVRDVQRHRRG